MFELPVAVTSTTNQGGSSSGGGLYGKGRKRRRATQQNQTSHSSNFRLFDIFDELANVVSIELTSMERAKRLDVNFESRI